jgi:hypothetical protein
MTDILTKNAKIALYNKSKQSGYSTDILEEVYTRGYDNWDRVNNSPEQSGFDRVNSFISDGYAKELDEDLVIVELYSDIPSNRFIGSNSLTRILKNATPGQKMSEDQLQPKVKTANSFIISPPGKSADVNNPQSSNTVYSAKHMIKKNDSREVLNDTKAITMPTNVGRPWTAENPMDPKSRLKRQFQIKQKIIDEEKTMQTPFGLPKDLLKAVSTVLEAKTETETDELSKVDVEYNRSKKMNKSSGKTKTIIEPPLNNKMVDESAQVEKKGINYTSDDRKIEKFKTGEISRDKTGKRIGVNDWKSATQGDSEKLKGVHTYSVAEFREKMKKRNAGSDWKGMLRKEETEVLDELSKSKEKEYKKEDEVHDKKNAKKHDMSVKDWEGSPGDNKDDKKLKKKIANESVEPLDEVSVDKLKKYVSDAESAMKYSGTKQKDRNKMKDGLFNAKSKLDGPDGTARVPAGGLRKEERALDTITDILLELSKGKLEKYIPAAKSAERHYKNKWLKSGKRDDSAIEKYEKHSDGAELARLKTGKKGYYYKGDASAKVRATEEVEVLDELSNKTLKSYVKKSQQSAKDLKGTENNANSKFKHGTAEGPAGKKEWKDEADWAKHGVEKRLTGINAAKKRLGKPAVEMTRGKKFTEDVEVLDETGEKRILTLKNISHTTNKTAGGLPKKEDRNAIRSETGKLNTKNRYKIASKVPKPKQFEEFSDAELAFFDSIE